MKYKFRIWNKKEKKFEKDLYEFAITGEGSLYLLENNQNGFLWAYPENKFEREIIYEVNWFTGLQDQNGKDIYEGDLLKLGDNEIGNEYIGKIVETICRQGCFMIKTENFTIEAYHYEFCSEIIGNIYENPELLENKNG